MERKQRLPGTSSLLRSPRNAERLVLALDQARRGEGLEISVEELRHEVLGEEGVVETRGGELRE